MSTELWNLLYMASSNNNIQSVLGRIATAVSVSGRKIAENQDVATNAVRELNARKQDGS